MINYPTIAWHVPERVIRVTYPSTYTEADLEATVSAGPVIKMLDAGVDPFVHIIQDFTAIEKFQLNNLHKLLEINRRRGRVELYRHPKLGWIVDAGHPHNPILRLDSVVTQVFNAHHQIVHSLDAADRFLKTVDDDLARLQRC